MTALLKLISIMNNSTFVFSKNTQTDTAVQFDISPLLKFGETLVSVAMQAISPVTTPALTITLTSAINVPVVQLLLKSGSENISYGAQILITTNSRQLTALVAVSVISDVQVPYTTQNPDAYTDLVDTIQAGTAAIGTAVFSFPVGIDPSGGYVNWEFLDSSGTVYANGNAFDYKIQSNGLSNVVFARAIINFPSSVPESSVDPKYQLRYTLTLSTNSTQSSYFSYENVTVTGLTSTPTGTQDSIELQGNKATVSIVIDKLYDFVQVQLYQDNTMIGSAMIQDFSRVDSGYYYAGVFDTAQLNPSLEPYTVVWNYGFTSNPNEILNKR